MGILAGSRLARSAPGDVMNKAELEAFTQIAELGSFSAAASQLHLTQPAISKRIASLENSLGSRLFDRLGKRVLLTPAGERLLPQAQHILLAMIDAAHAVHNLHNHTMGELRLATSHHIGLHRLAPILKRFNRDYAQVTLAIRFEDSEAAHELVRQAAVELAVVTLNPDGDTELQRHQLWRDPLVFIAASDHSLAQQQQVSLAELAALPCIMPGLDTYTGRIADALFAGEGLTLQPAMATNYLETIGMLVSTGIGWSLLPKSMLVPGLKELPVPVALERQLGVVTHPRRTLSNAAVAFLNTLEALAAP